MYVLGLSGGYHDAAAALLHNGKIVAAVEQERVSRVKHDRAFPLAALRECLRIGGITGRDVGRVAWYERPRRKLLRALAGGGALSLSGAAAFGQRTPEFLDQSLFVKRSIFRALDHRPPVEFIDHHLSHAASAFYPSKFQSAAIITCDGVGEWETNGIWFGSDSGIFSLETIQYPDSLGLFYSAITQYCGFFPNRDEYKLMGLAAFGTPGLRTTLEDNVIALFDDGSYRLDRRCFSFESDRRMFTDRLQEVLGAPPRTPSMELRKFDRDLAASVQAILEDQLLRQATRARVNTGARRLCLAGGVALNGVANGRIARSKLFEALWIQPAASDAGAALGAALAVWHRISPYSPASADGQRNSYLGPDYSDETIRETLKRCGIAYEPLSPTVLCERVASSLADGQVVGWFQGRMEFGPRALGNRSILADPRRPDMRERINSKIKHREAFRPFAPVVTESDAARFFDLSAPSPYMLEVHDVKRAEHATGEGGVSLPAVTHSNGTARIQTITEDANPLLFALLRSFERLAGIPILLNTSFNDAEEPIVCTPEQALRTAKATNLDLLVLGSCLVTRDALATASLRAQTTQPQTSGRRTAGRLCIIICGAAAYLVWSGVLGGIRTLRPNRRDIAASTWRRVPIAVESGAYPLY